MAIIYSYPQYAPKPEDLLIGTVTLDENAVVPIYDNPTVSFTIQSLLDMIAPITGAQNLQQVTNIGATTSNAVTFTSDIKVTGRFYDSSGSPGLAGQVLSSTVTGTSWIVNSPASVTSVGLTMPAAFTVANSPITTAGVLTVTGAGTAAQYINGLGNLVTFPTIPTPYVLPVATTAVLGGIKIGYTEAGKNYPLELSNEQAFVNVPWTDTIYTLPLAADGTRGGVQIGYVENAKNYPVELSSEKMFVNVPWTDTPYVLPVATSSDLGGVKIGYTENAKNYPVELSSDQMFVNVPWTDTQNPFQTITGTGSDNTNSGVLLSNSGGTVLILGSGSVTAAQTGNTITLTGTDTGVTGVTLATADSAGAPLVESIANRELTLTSAKYIGGANVGYVPEGGTGTTYLKGDGTWASIPTGLQFQGTWDASGGGGGNPNLTLAGNKGAGFLWICDVAGTAYPNGGSNPPSTWALGDWCVYDGTAWTRVPATNAGVTSLTTTDGTFIDLTPNTATTGAVTVTADLSAQDGTSDTSTKFLSKDNTWDVPSYTTDTNTQNIYTNSWQASTNDIILRKVLSGAGSGTQDIKIVKGANITFTYTDADNFTIAATDTQENTTWYIRDSDDADKTVNNLKYLKFVTATGTLGTALTGAGSTGDPYIMTLTSPDTNTQNTYTAGAGLSLSNFVFSADIDTTAASHATNSLSTDSTRYYAVQLDNNSTAADRKMVVNVPWSSGGTYSWKVRDNASTPVNKTLLTGEFLQFKTATGALATGLAGAGTTTDPYVMTLTSPNDNDNTLYTLAGAADGSVAANYNLVLSADGTAQNTMVFKKGSNITFTRAANSLTIAAANDNDQYTLAGAASSTAGEYDLVLSNDGTEQDTMVFKQGSNITFTRAADLLTITATNTWNANTKTIPGYVAAPGAVASKVWKTDASGNPAWRDDADTQPITYTISVAAPGSNNTNVTITPSAGTASTIQLTAGTFIKTTPAAASAQTTLDLSASGTASSSTFLRGDNAWATPPNDDTQYTAGTGLSLSNEEFSIDSTVVTLTGTQTLTNKTLTTPVIDQISPSAGLVQIDGAGTVDGGIKLMCYAGTHGQILKSQPHSAGVTNTMLLPAGSSSTLVSNVSTSTLTNKSGNISMWTNDSGYLTSYTEADTLQSVTARGDTTNQRILMNGSGSDAYLYVAGNAATTAPTNDQGMAFVYNNSGGSRENEIYFNPGIVTPAENATYYFALINEYLNSSSSNARVTDTLFKLYGNGNLELTGPTATSTIANTFWRMPKTAAPGTGYYLSKASGSINLVWTAPPTTGDITSVTAGTGMTGGGTSGGVTLNVIGGNGITANANDITMSGSYTGDLTITGDAVTDSYRFRANHSNPTTSTATLYDQSNVGATISAYRFAVRSYDGTNMLASALFTDTSLTVVGDVVAYGSPSDVRLKENIKPIKSALDKVSKLQGVTFDWKKSDSILDIKEDVGFIAQDVQKVMPELVRENKDGMLSMRHQGIAPILLEAIKELKAEIEELKSNKCNCNK
jgi:hypothetical protein